MKTTSSLVIEKNGGWLVIAIGTLLTLITFWIVQNQLESHKKTDFEWAASNRFRAFNQAIDYNFKSIKDFDYLAQSSSDISADMLEKYADFILADNTDLTALAWGFYADSVSSQPHSAQEKLTFLFIKSADKDNPQGQPSQFQSPEILARVKESVERGVISAYPLARQDEDDLEFVVIMPMQHRKSDNEDPNQYPKKAFITGFFNLASIVQSSIGILEPRGIDIYIHEQNNRQLLYFYASRLGGTKPDSHWEDNNHHQLTYLKKIDIAGWPLGLTIMSTDRFRSAEAFEQAPLVVMLIGSLFTSVVFLYLFHLKRTMLAQQRTERALKESEARLRTLFEHSPDIIMVLDRQSQVLFVNHSFPNFNITIGENFLGLLSANHQHRFRKKLKKVFKSQKVKTLQYSFSDASWWEARLVPIVQNQQAMAAMTITTDITENRLLQAQAIESSRLASIGVLAAGVAHEVNNPNNSIYFNASMLSEAWRDIQPILTDYYQQHGDFSMGGLPFSEMKEKAPELLSWILDNSNRIKKIVANLKNFVRKEKDDFSERVKLFEVLRDSLAILDNQINQCTNNFVFEFPELRPLVKGNKQQLEQVFVNIIFNALQSLTHLDQRVSVSVSYDSTEEKVTIQVADEGKGIPQDQLQMIREPFFTTKNDIGGIGLGLPISINIIENHAGQISFNSVVGNGTTVAVSLPTSGLAEATYDAD